MSSVLLIKPKLSFCLLFFFLFVYSVSVLLCVLAPMPGFFHWVIPVFLLVHGLYVLRRFVFYRHRLSLQRVWCDAYGRWNLQCQDAHVRPAQLVQYTVLSRYLVLLSFKVPGRFLPMVLPLGCDSESRQVMYELRYTLVSRLTADSVSL